MAFRTKLDYSDNRQIKQRERTNTILSGTTIFGVPFSGLTSGPDLTTSAQTSQYFGVISTYSGNSTNTVFTWAIPSVSIVDPYISALTPSNSGTSQNIGAVFASSNSTIIDGNVVNLTYSGVSAQNLYAITMSEPTPGNYTGTVSTDFFIFSAGSLDFTGRTIWIDNAEILRTKKLIVSENPQPGYVLTSNFEGEATWQSVSAITSGTTFWSASTGNFAIVTESSGNLAFGDYSLAEGRFTTALGEFSHSEGNSTTAFGDYSHAEGSQTTALGEFSHSEGNNTTASGDYSHSEGAGTRASGNYSHAEGFATSSGTYSHAEGDNTTASGNASHAEGANTTASNINSHAEGKNTTAIGLYSHAEGILTTAIGTASHSGGYITTANGLYSFVHGNNSIATANSTIVLGDNLNGTTANHTYVESLNINLVGATAFVNDIRIDANGFLTTNTSDERLKENINPISNALNKIKNLQGVTYQWKDRSAGGDNVRLGFIAQQVENVEPLLVFTNKNSEYKGIHIDGVIPLLVEAIKELTTTDGLILETQTVVAEDNNIELNYNGTKQTSIGGGISVINGIDNGISAEFKLNPEGSWVTNNSIAPLSLIIPQRTPTSSSDNYGKIGDITRDEDYLYVKGNNGWKRLSLESF